MAIQKVGVVGCGLMGSGIAQIAAATGHATTILEVEEKFLEKGIASIHKSLQRFVEKGKMSEADRDAVVGRIKGTTKLSDLAPCDIVIEAATENAAIKTKLFADLDALLAPHALLASNTSSLTIIELAAATKRPDKVVGLHFFNPVPIMKLVEVVKTIATSDQAYAEACDFGRKLGKEVVEAKDSTGFVVNRLLVPYMLDAIRCYEQGLASAKTSIAA
jgi:3-hydroxybutyryl-CoA dehydrogenase